MSNIITTTLVAGLLINLADISVTLLFAAKPWNEVLVRQGLKPSPLTPPFYIAANFIGGAILVLAYNMMSQFQLVGPATALLTSLGLWFVTRLYGAGHAVMGQMPWRLFAIMSTGLGLGYVAAGQFIAWAL
jgi:hypothetical protein